jgi:uncharacterized membrane protein (UPF0127 family)
MLRRKGEPSMVNPTGLIILFVLIQLAANQMTGGNDCRIEVYSTYGKPVPLQVEIADSEPLRMKGLMDRKKLPWDRGMLFVFEKPAHQNFWMKNTYIPLSIAYISSSGVINEIYDMKPLDTSVTYPSTRPARYALEVNQGWFEKNNITRGCSIVLHGCVSK